MFSLTMVTASEVLASASTLSAVDVMLEHWAGQIKDYEIIKEE